MTTGEDRLVARLVLTTAGLGILVLLGAVVAGSKSPVLALRLAIAAATCGVLFLIFLYRRIALAKRRRLDAMQRAELLDDVRKMPPVPALVSAPKDDEEARSYARQLLEVLREAGWSAHGVRRVENDPNVADAEVVFRLSDPIAPPPVRCSCTFRCTASVSTLRLPSLVRRLLVESSYLSAIGHRRWHERRGKLADGMPCPTALVAAIIASGHQLPLVTARPARAP
jgi:hypothetical protein